MENVLYKGILNLDAMCSRPLLKNTEDDGAFNHLENRVPGLPDTNIVAINVTFWRNLTL
jgi:hypothetical protein